MKNSKNIVALIKGFPDFKATGFNMDRYNQQFREKNLVISACSNKIKYDKHWGGLSLKFVINGVEHYQTDYSTYAVDKYNYLILNKDTEYSSNIDSEEKVESFTLNFSGKYINEFVTCVDTGNEKILDNDFTVNSCTINFIEKLYQRDNLIVPFAFRIYQRLESFEENNDEIAELFSYLFTSLLELNKLVDKEINSVDKIKISTKIELYKRLNFAKDYIDACYNEETINLDSICSIACLNREYFIRQFQKQFHITPVQYLIKKRMEIAQQLLQNSKYSITEVCQKIGYTDLTSFGKLFKRYYKISPTQFKNTKC